MSRIEVDTGIDYAQLEKDLANVQRRIKSVQTKIEKDKIKLDINSEAMAEAGGRLDEAQKKLYGLKALAADNQAVLSLPGDEAATLPGKIAEAEAEVKVLQKEFNKAADAVDRTNTAIEQSNRELTQVSEKEQEIAGAIQANTVATEEYGEVTTVSGKRAEDAFDRIAKRLKGLVKRVLFFSLFTRLLGGLRSYIGGFITENDEAAAAIGRLKGAFETLMTPLLSAVIPVLVTVVNWITRIINAVIQLIALLTGKTVAAMQTTAKNAKKTAGATGKAAKSLAAFDTVQKLDSGSSGGGGGGGANAIQPLYDLSEMTQAEMLKILGIVLAIGSAIAAWRMGTGLAGALKNFIGLAMIAAGLILTIKNYLDAWNNGISFDNLADMMAGIILLIGGVLILLGPVAAGFTAIAAGVALVVLAFKDMSANGVNLQNTLTLVLGVLTIGIGLFAATGSAIFAVIGVIAAAVVAVMGFGGTLGKFVESVKGIFHGLITFFTGVFTGDWKKAWEGLKEVFKNVWNAILAIVGGVINAMVRGINFIIDKINTLQWDVPDWVPFIGGQHWGFNFGHVSEWKIPYLAQGAVIPPNREFMAVLGDQKSGTNIEAPLETMVQAFRMANQGQNINIRFTGSLAEVARMLKPEIDYEGFRTGEPIGGTL